MPVVIDPDTDTAAALVAALPPGTHSVDDRDRLLAWLDQHPNEYVVVLGPHVAQDEWILLCENLRTTRPTLIVLLVLEDLHISVLTRAMRVGVREVVASGDLDGLGKATVRAQELHTALCGPAGAAVPGRVVTVYSPKGGVGKTMLSINLAVALADGGARRVCLVDLDLTFGDVAIAMQLVPPRTIEHAVGSENSLDLELVESMVVHHESGVHVLAAPSDPEVRDRVSAFLVNRLLQTLRSGYDYIVLDTAPNFDEQTLTALDECDECIVVTTLDVPTLKNVKIGLETLGSLSIASGHQHLVLNRADENAGITAQRAEEILGTSIPTRLASSPDVAFSTNAGIPITVSSPGHPVSAAVRDLAGRLGGGVVLSFTARPAEAEQPTGRRRRMRR